MKEGQGMFQTYCDKCSVNCKKRSPEVIKCSEFKPRQKTWAEFLRKK